jgi:competence protein ComFC
MLFMWSRTKERYTDIIRRAVSLAQAGGHVLWPGRCLACKAAVLPSDDRLCQSCWQELSKAVSAEYCRRCGRDVSPYGIVLGRCGHCQDKQYQYDGIIRVGRYESTLRSMTLSLKFAERTEWAATLSGMLRQAVMAVGMHAAFDCLVPVPLHWRRRLGRGFNQSHLLAKGLKLPSVPVSTDLVRIRNTEQQWNLKPPQRRRNVKGAFAVRKGHPFDGKTVALVDDITTSGATLEECAKILKQAGAQKVVALVIAAANHD